MSHPAAAAGEAPYGLMAEFATPEELLEAAQRAQEEGYTRVEAYSPMPIHGMEEALRLPRTRLPYLVFLAGLLGATVGYGLCYYISVVAYPLNVGGRPYHSGPAFIPVTFEMTILFASLATVVGMLAANGLPRPYHPAFNLASFARASQDRFFLGVEAADPQFDPQRTRRFLEELDALEVSLVSA
ncbi:MAG: DUF3341 domain-containing protein [Candidatus Latescibacterota bacterium]